MYLQNAFFTLFLPLSSSETTCKELFEEVFARYSEKHRFYHTLEHIEHMLLMMQVHEKKIEEPRLFALAVWFHDIIYNPLSTSNEKKSAEFAVTKLAKLDLKTNEIDCVRQLILSTAKHQPLLSFDTQKFFLDIDLSILSADSDVYDAYGKNVRKEYAQIPDFIFYPKRKKILEGFLCRERIYFTEIFFEKHEQKARENLRREIASLV